MGAEKKVSYDLKRFAGIKRDYNQDDVERLRGSIKIEYSICKQQSTKLWNLLNSEPYVNTLGSLSGNHAVQHAKAGLKAIYLSGWQVAADANSAGEMYPDQSLYPYDSAPKLVEAMNNALLRADQIQHMEIKDGDQKKEKREHPNKLMSAKECMETKSGIGWFLGAADDVFEDIKKHGDSKDKSWNDKKWADAIALSALASNYSTVYDVWCKDMIDHRMKMRIHGSHKDHMKEKKKKKD